MLIGEKVNLRRIEKPDLWQLWKWHEEQESYLFVKAKPFISYDELEKGFIRYFGWKRDFIIENKAIKPLGICSYREIDWKNRSCTLLLQLYEHGSEQSFALGACPTIHDYKRLSM
jgi:hypothetical protein